jgi:hypothetical protein
MRNDHHPGDVSHQLAPWRESDVTIASCKTRHLNIVIMRSLLHTIE